MPSSCGLMEHRTRLHSASCTLTATGGMPQQQEPGTSARQRAHGACLSRMHGNVHVRSLRGAGRSNAPGLPGRSALWTIADQVADECRASPDGGQPALALRCRIEPYLDQERRRCAAPLARPPPCSALGTPARHGRAAVAQGALRSVTLIRQTGAAVRSRLPRPVLSSSRPPRHWRPYGPLARDRLRRPLTGSPSDRMAQTARARRVPATRSLRGLARERGGTRPCPLCFWLLACPTGSS